MAAFLARYSVTMLTLDDVGLQAIDASEEGATFSEVAARKFEQYAQHVQDPYQVLFADDSGVSIDALNGEPGVKSRRWKDGKTKMSDQELINYLLERMKDIPQGQRTARFTSSVAYGKPGDKPTVVIGEVRGVILLEPHMQYATPGYPYRTLFYVEGEDQMLSDLEKDPTWDTHRDIAMKKMMADLGFTQQS